MDFKRGAFRSWIVLSIIWVAVCVNEVTQQTNDLSEIKQSLSNENLSVFSIGFRQERIKRLEVKTN